MLNFPDLNRLRVFHLVYQLRSLVKAAEALNISRSAISQSLKNLEGELGLRLFIRTSKAILPTAAAQALFQTIDPMLLNLTATLQSLDSDLRNPVGHLKIGAPQDFGTTLLTDLLIEFRKKNPQITFEIKLGNPILLLDQLSSGALNMAFVDNADLHSESYPVSLVTVLREKFILVCSNRYFQNQIQTAQPNLEKLKTLNFVDYLADGPTAKLWIKHHFKKSVTELRVVYSVDSVRGVLRAIQGHQGLGVVPRHLVESELKLERLKVLHPNAREWTNSLSLARRIGHQATAREQAFVDFYKKHLGINFT